MSTINRILEHYLNRDLKGNIHSDELKQYQLLMTKLSSYTVQYITNENYNVYRVKHSYPKSCNPSKGLAGIEYLDFKCLEDLLGEHKASLYDTQDTFYPLNSYLRIDTLVRDIPVIHTGYIRDSEPVNSNITFINVGNFTKI